jgi:asparagine synthase (glutamine-hydrolysing)
MLTGEMGNITMSYNGLSLFPQLALKGRWWRLCNEIAASGYRWKYMLRHSTIAPFIPVPVFRRYKQWRRRGRPPWDDFAAILPGFAARSGVVDRASREYLPFDAPPPRDGRLARIHSVYCYSEAADWFAKLRASFGIDTRAPAFDRRVVEFCIGIPEDQYLRKGRDRWLIRRAMNGRLPNVVLANKKSGAQAADWFPRLTRERDRIAAELNRFAINSDVSSIIDIQKLKRIVHDWPDREPPEYGPGHPWLWALPQALGAAYFIENVTGENYGHSKASSVESTNEDAA